MKKLILLGLLAFTCGAAYAQYHVHAWQKQNEIRAVGAYGEKIKICSWKCTDFTDGSVHYTQTQGQGFCPMPTPSY